MKKRNRRLRLKKPFRYILGLLVLVLTLSTIYVFLPKEDKAKKKKEEPVVQNLPLSGKKVYIDAGHGGYDPGATKDGVNEKDLNLEITLKLKKELEGLGVKVYLIRDKDEEFSSKFADNKKRSDLNYRIRTINTSDADIFLTIHMNMIEQSKWRGAQVFHVNKEDNTRLGFLIQESLKNILKNTTRENAIKRDSYLLTNTDIPGVLVECGFMSNPDELKLLSNDEYQSQLAHAIASGILDYFLPGL